MQNHFHLLIMNLIVSARASARWALFVTLSFFVSSAIFIHEAYAEWLLSRAIDPFTDQETITAHVETHRGTIFVRCKDDDFVMYVSVDEFLSTKGVNFKYRVDQQEVVETRGPVSADGVGVFFNFPETHARRFMTGEVVLFEVYDYRGVGHRRKFSLSGADAPIKDVLTACGSRTSVPEGLDLDVVKGVDNWPNAFTLLAKRSLSNAGFYKGNIDDNKDDSIYFAVQKAKPGFIRFCSQIENKYRNKESLLFSTIMKKGEISTYNLVEHYASSALRQELKEYWLNR